MPTDPAALQQAIARLQAFRASLGDAAVDAAVLALRRHAEAAAATADAPAGPRLRQISVLFADVANSTAMLSQVDAEDAAHLLGTALQRFADAVQRWGGQVLRFTGDGIKAAFGVHGLLEDEAERAVKAGLQIIDDAARHAESVERELGVRGFAVRVGIHTGPVLLGEGVEAERTAMGAAVHLAARMEQSAPEGRLRVSDATWAQVRGLFRAQEQPPLHVKGVEEPLRTWLVDGVEDGPEPSVQRGVDGIDTPMIGRDAELARLCALHADAAQQRTAAAALVLGDAGVGKTRLRRELLAALGLQEGAPGLLQARAQPSGALQPYGLLRQLLARWLDIRDDHAADAARERLVAGLAPWLGADAAQQAPRIGHLVGLDFALHPAVQALSAAALREQAFAALRDALHARARAAPLLLVLDDLHWADDESLDFVRTQLLMPAPLPLSVLLLARPALATERGFAAPDGVETIVLAPLPAAHGEALVDALLAPLDRVPPALRRLLLDRADGNPFFLEALVRMLIDDGVIDTAARPWRLHDERLAALRVPPTLVGVLQARLDALPASDLIALQDASIIGTVFWDDALHSVDPAAPDALPALRRRALVVPRAGSAFAQTAERGFSHQLLHETTYGTVLKPRRREGHARVARWLAERVGDRASEFLAITAEHYERAGDSAQALEYWDRAQDDAFNRYANTAALEFIERALAQPALADMRWRFALLVIRHEVLDRLGREAACADACDAMQAWAEQCDDDAMRADVATTRMLQADRAGRPDEAQAHAERALALAAASGEPAAAAAAAFAHGELAWLALQRDEGFDAAARHIAAGLGFARITEHVPRRAGGEPGMELKLRAIEVEAFNRQERYADALRAIDAALLAVAAQTRTVVQHRFNFLHRRGIAERLLGRGAAALATARDTLALARDSGIARHRLAALGEVAQSALDADDLDAAAEALAEAEPLAAEVDDGFALPTMLEHRGELLRRQGRHDAARDAWQRALALYGTQERRNPVLTLRCALAGLAHEDGRAADAFAAIDAVLADTAADPRPNRRALLPGALIDAYHVLAAAGDERAPSLLDDLRVRLDEQLAQLDDAAARDQLLRGAPAWRAARALLDAR